MSISKRLKSFHLARPDHGNALLEFLAVAFLVFVTLVRSLSIEDINFWDETNYLSMGLSVGSGQLAQFPSGPTYGYFYFLINQIFPDPVSLYFAGRAAAAALLILGVWYSARLFAGPMLAWVAGAAIATTPAPYAWPGVATPAAAALLVGCAVMLRWRNLVSIGVASALFWIAAGSRPEFSWLALVVTLTAVVWAALTVMRGQPGQPKRRRFGVPIATGVGAIAVPAILVFLHGSPFLRTGRDWVAFGQHFSQRNFTQGEDPWLNWQEITARAFPNSEGVSSALLDNPQAFAGHIVSNIRATPRSLIGETLGVTSTPALLTTLTGLVALSLFLGLVVAILVQPKGARAKANDYLNRFVLGTPANKVVLALVALTVFAAVIPLVIIFPRVHYLVFPSAALIVGLVVVQAKIGSPRYSCFLPVWAVVILFLAFSGQTYTSIQQRVINPPVIAGTANALAANGEEWRLLGVDPGLEVYVPGLRQVSEVDIEDVNSFPSLLEREDITAVLVNTRLAWANWSELDQFDLFLEDPSQFGFRQVTPGSPVWVRDTP